MDNPFASFASEKLDHLYMMSRKHKRDWRVYLVAVFVLLIISTASNFSAPKAYPEGRIITLRAGAGLAELSKTLQDEQVVRSAALFRISAILFGGERGMQAGDYYLRERQTVTTLAWRMVHGERDIATAKITIPEGYTVAEISSLFSQGFPLFNQKEFETQAPEGFLFPDTYFFLISTTASATQATLHDNFHTKVDPLLPAIKTSGHSLQEIITTASILEAEAKTPDDMAIVAGIIWKRLKKGMLLQVDADPNTYKEKGLPEHPINNPGLTTITAALHPKDSPYLYYISDKTGAIHYAKTLDEQTANINKYLK